MVQSQTIFKMLISLKGILIDSQIKDSSRKITIEYFFSSHVHL